MTEKRIAIVIDADGKAGVAAFDANTGAAEALGHALDDLAGKSKRSGDEADKAGSKWEAAGKKIGLFVSGAALGFAALVGSQIKVADETGKLAAKVGVTTEFISEMGYAAKASGANAKILESGLFALSESAVKAEAGARRPAAAFKALGVDVLDANGKLKSLETLLPPLADRFRKMADGPKEAALANAIFGSSAKDLLPLLNQGADGMAELRQRAQELGLTVSGETATAAAGLNDQIDLMKAQLAGAAMQIAQGLLPQLVDMSTELATAAQRTSDLQSFGEGLGTVLRGLGDAFGFVAGMARQFGIDAAAAMEVAGGLKEMRNNLLSFGLADGSVQGGAGRIASARQTRTDMMGQAAAARRKAELEADIARLVRGGVQYDGPLLAGGDAGNAPDPSLADVFGPRPRDNSRARDADLKRQQQAMQRYREEAERLAAELQGPLRVAEVEHSQRIARLTEDLANHNIDQATFNRLKALADEQLAKTSRAITEQQDILGRIRADYQAELQLIGLSAQARRVEEEMIRRVNDAKRAGLTDEEIKASEGAWRAEIEIHERVREAMEQRADAARAFAEQQRQDAEDVLSAWVGAASGMTRAIGDFFANGLRGGKDFVRSLKDTFRRLVSDLVTMMLDQSLVRPFQQMLASGLGLSSGGLVPQQQGATGGNALGGVMQAGFDGLLAGMGKLFGRGGAAAAGIEAATAAGTGTAMDGAFAALQAAGVRGSELFMPTSGVIQQYGGMGGMGAMALPLGLLGGAALGWSMGGDNAGKLAGGLAGTALAADVMIGQQLGGALLGPVGWAALAAMAVNKLTGGKLFGTKFKTESGAQQFDIGAGGASGYTSTTEVRQQSFFRGRKWRTTTEALDSEAQGAIDELFDALQKTVADAAQKLGVTVPAIVGGSFRREFDAQGNLTREFGTIAGRVYNEAQDAFAARLVGENLLAVAKLPGGAGEIEQLAERYRTSGDTLQAFATFMLAVQDDIRNAQQLWTASGDGVLTTITDKIAGLAHAGESLAEAYARVIGVARQYGDLIGGVKAQIATHGLNDYQRAQVDVEMGYRAMVKQANELAKSLGLSGARAEDLAAIEQLRAIQMADLQAQYARQIEDQRQAFLDSLNLGDLSPLRDEEKLGEAMQMLRDAANAGDWQTVQQRAQQALSLGRDMYASGADYNGLYAQVRDIIGGMTMAAPQLEGLADGELIRIADLLESQPREIARELFALLGPASTPVVQPAPAPPPPGNGNGGDGGSGSGDRFRDRFERDFPQMIAGIDRVATNTLDMADSMRAIEESQRVLQTRLLMERAL